VLSLAAKRCTAEYLQQTYSVSERRACVVLSLDRSSARRQPGYDQTRELGARIHALSELYPRFGYRKIYYRLKLEGTRVSRERVRLIRKQEGLQVMKKPRRRRPLGVSTAMPTRAQYPNHVWSYDFLHDETSDGRRLKCLTLRDEYTREGLAIYCARSITASDVVRVLEELFAGRGAPACLKSDNGPELMAKQVMRGLKSAGSRLISSILAARGRTDITRVSTACSEMVVSIAGPSTRSLKPNALSANGSMNTIMSAHMARSTG
jgi:putative transposase